MGDKIGFSSTTPTIAMATCSGCGFVNPQAAAYCCGCGNSIQQAPLLEKQAERRILSVIFCDIVGSTTLSEQIDPEDLRSLLISYHNACMKVVEKFDGFLAELMGDGVVIYFGYPRAHEDDEVRSIRCALTLLTAVQDLSVSVRHPFDVRIGVHRGRVVVGALGGAAGTQSLAIGETPNLAARLQAEASPGEVVVSDSLWRQVSHTFHGQPLGARRLKGIQRPVEIHRVIAYRPVSGYRSSAAAFVGRKQELDIFVSKWSEVHAGQPQAILLRGEPGIGKSRLIHHFSNTLVEPSTTVMEAYCNSFSTDTPYYPFRELLRNRLSLDGLEPDEQLERLRGRLADLRLPLSEALPLMALFLEIPIDQNEWPTLSDLSLVRRRQQTLNFLIQGLIALVDQSPLLLIVEDLHWADASTIELLDQLLTGQFIGRFMVVLSARLEFRNRWLDEPHVSEIILDTLNAAESETVIRDVAADKAIPYEVVREIFLRSSGNPLFLEEITLTVISSNSLVEREHTWELLEPLSSDMVPTSMEAALMARLDKLGNGKNLLQIGATLGREFNLDLLSAVTPIELPKLQNILSELVDEGLLYISGSKPLVYTFKHALVQDVAYNSLLRSSRLENHYRIAQVLMERFPDIPKRRPELLAHHLSGAGRYKRAAHYWQVAGNMAAERNAVNEAIDHFSRSLIDLKQLPEEESRLQQELDLHTALAPVQMAAFGWGSPLVQKTCQVALDLVRIIGAEDQKFAPLWGLWANQFVSGKLDEAKESAYEILELASSKHAQIYAVPARHATAYTSFYRGEFEASIQHAEIGLSLFDYEIEQQMCQNFQLSPTINILTAKASSLWMRGNQSEGALEMDRMLSLARSLRHPTSLASALAFRCFFSFYNQDWQDVKSAAHEAMELSIIEGFSMWYVCAAMYKSYAELALSLPTGNPYKVVEYAKLFRQTGSLVTDCSTTCILISTWKHLQLYEEALKESEVGLMTAEIRQLGVMKPEILRLRGSIFSTIGDMAAAGEAYQQAVDLAREQGALSLELRCLLSLLAHRRSLHQNLEVINLDLRRLLDCFESQEGRSEIQHARDLLEGVSR